MIKVIVVDDNFMIRCSIIKTMDWKSLNCEIVGQASDGVEAIDTVNRFKPDLIITDIKMPGIDGLELTEYVKNLLPMTKVIIITGYDDFKYAQRAVKLGAFDLILKPIDDESLYKILKEAAEEIETEKMDVIERQKVIDEKNRLKSQMDNSNLELRQKLIIDIIQNNFYDKSDIKDRSERLGLSFSRHITFIISPESNYNEFERLNEEKVIGYLKIIQEALKSVKGIYDFEFTDCWINHEFSVVVVPRKFENNRILYSKLSDICKRISDKLLKNTEFQFTIGVSSILGDIKEVRKSYEEAQSALKTRFFINNRIIFYAQSYEDKNTLSEYSIMKKINCLYDAVRDGESGIEQLINEIFDELRMSSSSNTGYIKSLLMQMCMTVERILYEKSGIPENSIEVHKKISSLTNINEAFKYVWNFIMGIHDRINAGNLKNYSSAIRKVIDYLKENYHKKITLGEVSDLVVLSPAHLSRLIKKETGETFVDLMNNIKIDEAARLLRNTNLKVYEVGNEVGIDNYAYFYQLFKKVKSLSPKEYKDKYFNIH